MHFAMQWIGAALRHEQVWLSDAPRSQTETLAAEIARELFRIHAHFYHHHLRDLMALDLQQHLNTCAKRFAFFAGEFGLLDEAEQQPLAALFKKLTKRRSVPG